METDRETRREIGRRNLREVIGDEYFENRERATNSFNMPLRIFSEENCFGDLWERKTFDRKMRSLLLIGMLTGANRVAEVKLHVRGVINSGGTVEEIQEVLYQCILYLGLPAAVESFKAAEEVLKEMGKL
jgi:4-carboxymuconolactone decarboxylase